MKQGEHPPDEVRALAVRLAARNPRPTNAAIQAAVKEHFGIAVSTRSISRYCQKAGVPTSSRSTENRGQGDGYIVPDPLLVSHRQQHQEDLCALATELREQISVAKPHELMRDTAARLFKRIWVVDGQGRWMLPAEQHEPYPFLRSHLKEDELWQGLDHLRAKLPEYHQQGADLLADIRKLATDRRYADCPIASSSDGEPPCITPWFGDLVYYEAVLTVVDSGDPIQEPYLSEPRGEGVVGLMINASYIAYAAYIAYAGDYEDLERLEYAHRRLRKKWRGHPRPRQLVERYQELVETMKGARYRLEPNLVRQLVYRGNCERCP